MERVEDIHASLLVLNVNIVPSESHKLAVRHAVFQAV